MTKVLISFAFAFLTIPLFFTVGKLSQNIPAMLFAAMGALFIVEAVFAPVYTFFGGKDDPSNRFLILVTIATPSSAYLNIYYLERFNRDDVLSYALTCLFIVAVGILSYLYYKILRDAIR